MEFPGGGLLLLAVVVVLWLPLLSLLLLLLVPGVAAATVSPFFFLFFFFFLAVPATGVAAATAAPSPPKPNIPLRAAVASFTSCSILLSPGGFSTYMGQCINNTNDGGMETHTDWFRPTRHATMLVVCDPSNNNNQDKTSFAASSFP